MLRIAERYGLLAGVVRCHLFDLDDSEGIGLALSAHGLTSTQRTYAPDGPSPDSDACYPWMLGPVRLVFIDPGDRDHVAWLLAAEWQDAQHDRSAAAA